MEATAPEVASRGTKTVLLAGKIGSGKTYILNKICGTDFASKMCPESCTRTIQQGNTRSDHIRVIDTPGFYSSDDIAAHTEAQRMAMEQNALSGIYVVVKFGRSDEMAETLNKIMDFVGDSVRIIITHCDFLTQETPGVDMEDIKLRLSTLVDVNLRYIIAVGKHTQAGEIEKFIAATLHTPLKHELTELQLASVHDHCVGARKFNKAIQEIKEKIQAASVACHELSLSKFASESDRAIGETQKMTRCMVDEGKDRILREARELTLEQHHLLDQEINCSIYVPFEAFIVGTVSKNRRKPRNARVAEHSRLPELQAQFVHGSSESPKWRVEFLVGSSLHPTNAKLVVEKLREENAELNTTKAGKRRHKDPSAPQPLNKRKGCKTLDCRTPPSVKPNQNAEASLYSPRIVCTRDTSGCTPGASSHEFAHSSLVVASTRRVIQNGRQAAVGNNTSATETENAQGWTNSPQPADNIPSVDSPTFTVGKAADWPMSLRRRKFSRAQESENDDGKQSSTPLASDRRWTCVIACLLWAMACFFISKGPIDDDEPSDVV